jgi:hypothetical protein
MDESLNPFGDTPKEDTTSTVEVKEEVKEEVKKKTKLDLLRDKVVELQDGRPEDDIPLGDNYWDARNELTIEHKRVERESN